MLNLSGFKKTMLMDVVFVIVVGVTYGLDNVLLAEDPED